MSTSVPTAELRSATFEALAKIIERCPGEAFGLLPTLELMVEKMDDVCLKAEKQKEVVDSILAGKGTLTMASALPGTEHKELMTGSGTEECQMYLFEKSEERRSENECLRKQNQALMEKIKDLEDAQASRDVEMATLRQTMQKETSEVKDQLDQAKSNLTQLNALTDDLIERCHKAESLVVEKDATIKEQSAEIARSKSQKRAAKSSSAGQNQELVSLHARIREHQRTFSDDGRQEILRLQTWIFNHVGQAAAYEDRLEEKDALIAKQVEEITAQQQALEQALKESKDSERMMMRAAYRMDEYQTSLEEANERVEELQDELREATEELDEESRRAESVQRELDRLHRLRARDMASFSSRHDRRWAESEDEDEDEDGEEGEDDEWSEDGVLGAVHDVLRDSFEREQAVWGH